VQQEGGFAGAAALKGGDADNGRTLFESGQHAGQRFSAREGVELVAALDQTGGGCQIHIGAERHDQCRIQRPVTGHYPHGDRVDGAHH
jgi:hypothetical protein